MLNENGRKRVVRFGMAGGAIPLLKSAGLATGRLVEEGGGEVGPIGLGPLLTIW